MYICLANLDRYLCSNFMSSFPLGHFFANFYIQHHAISIFTNITLHYYNVIPYFLSKGQWSEESGVSYSSYCCDNLKYLFCLLAVSPSQQEGMAAGAVRSTAEARGTTYSHLCRSRCIALRLEPGVDIIFKDQPPVTHFLHQGSTS